MSDENVTKIAEQVSILMQLDRMRHHVGTDVDMKVLANVPDYIASVFETANAVGSDLTPVALYELVNKRISQVQAQLYMLRLEFENRHERDPAKIYADPLAISAYGERMETLVALTKNFDFGAGILAYGWYKMEHAQDGFHRWMRPGDVSVACVPHLGTVDQVLEINGYVMHAEQMDGLSIRVGDVEATIAATGAGSAKRFVATLALSADALKSANYVPVEFTMTDFRQPNDMDTRLLGANIAGFTCRPTTAQDEGADKAVVSS
jgi:hypothetical protein